MTGDSKRSSLSSYKSCIEATASPLSDHSSAIANISPANEVLLVDQKVSSGGNLLIPRSKRLFIFRRLNPLSHVGLTWRSLNKSLSFLHGIGICRLNSYLAKIQAVDSDPVQLRVERQWTIFCFAAAPFKKFNLNHQTTKLA